MKWFARFWWHDTVDEMQRKMLSVVSKHRRGYDNFVPPNIRDFT